MPKHSLSLLPFVTLPISPSFCLLLSSGFISVVHFPKKRTFDLLTLVGISFIWLACFSLPLSLWCYLCWTTGGAKWPSHIPTLTTQGEQDSVRPTCETIPGCPIRTQVNTFKRKLRCKLDVLPLAILFRNIWGWNFAQEILRGLSEFGSPIPAIPHHWDCIMLSSEQRQAEAVRDGSWSTPRCAHGLRPWGQLHGLHPPRICYNVTCLTNMMSQMPQRQFIGRGLQTNWKQSMSLRTIMVWGCSINLWP